MFKVLLTIVAHDQHRLPQGSAFVELYCAGNPHAKDRLPKELYSQDADRVWKLDLGRVATAGGAASPVWRLAVSAVHATAESSVEQRLYAYDLTLQPEHDRVPIERIVHFATASLPSSQQVAITGSGGIFYNQLRMPTLLAPKHYAVLGSRPETSIGTEGESEGSQVHIRLRQAVGNTVHVEQTGAEPYPRVGRDIKPSLGIVAAMDMDYARCEWTSEEMAATYLHGVGFHISMPLPNSPNFYPPPTANAAAIQRDDLYEPPLDTPLDADSLRPVGATGLLTEGTRENFRTVYLQRLADPTIAFHAKLNPYITVDWLPIDLTVFNGDQRKPEKWPGDQPWISEDVGADLDLHFASRERGLLSAENIWRTFSLAPGATRQIQALQAKKDNGAANGDVPSDDRAPFGLEHSLGFLTRFFGRSYIGMPQYMGDSNLPFPWLTWLDRPYHNQFELLLVPSASPARLLYEFNLSGGGRDPYRPNSEAFHASFDHLINFHQSSTGSVTGADLSRLLDFVGTPSPFTQSSTFFNPNQCATTDGFRPPFNRISRFRDPGRVNINTIHDARVWEAVCDGQVAWSDFQASRGPVEDASIPTRYLNPFRSACSADLMPLPGLERDSAQATLLRPDAEDPTKPLLQSEATEAFRNTDKNAFFRYQLLQQLGGRVTNHSNVFAVWVTIGFFEVVPNEEGIDDAHPDGFALSEELGMSLGQVNRHRAFYLIDRSIPIGFLPGENLNVDNCILLRRVLE